MSAMSRTNIDIDDHLLRNAMAMYGCRTKREAVDLALRKLVGDPMSREEALAMEGTGWDGDLEAMRFNEHADWTDRP
jgi:Arc/MetJ family transcription regulator